MYRIGSAFYAIYFLVSFPIFFIMDEEPARRRHTVWRVAGDALAAAMLVTLLLDAWRLMFGGLDSGIAKHGDSVGGGLPFLQPGSRLA